jgi:hypothetical protein
MTLTPIPNNGSQLERAIRAWFIAATADNASASRILESQVFVTLDNRPRENSVNGILIDIMAGSFQPSVQFPGNNDWLVRIDVRCPAAQQPGQHNPEANRLIADRFTGLIEAAMRQHATSETDIAVGDVTVAIQTNMDGFNYSMAGITAAGRALKTNGSSQSKANNADMDAFTCLFITDAGGTRGNPADKDGNVDESVWIESRSYRVTACATAVD